MNLVLYAIPAFVVLLLIELYADYRCRTGYYRTNDAIASLSTGILNQTMGFATKFAGFLAYISLWQLLPHPELSMTPWLWVAAFVIYDFCYYWKHRCQHQINVLWGIHVVHHQSEEYNLTTALRQPFNGFLIGALFYLPMLFMGFPPEVVITVGSLNLIYQYWVHTRFIGHLGVFEQFFVTPMNHRVHHAINDPYIDKNFGGVFILWDRLFGTYQAELAEEPCAYGVRKPLHSWNPFFANWQVHWQLMQDAWHARRWWDKLRIWFMPTGWRPEDVARDYPLPRCLPGTQHKYDRAPPRSLVISVVALHVLLMGYTLWFLFVVMSEPFATAALHFIPLGGGLWLNARILDQRRGAAATAVAFWLGCGALPWLAGSWLLPAGLTLGVAAVVAAGLMLALKLSAGGQARDSGTAPV